MPAKATASALESHLGYAMRIVSNAVSHGFARKMEADGVTVAEWVLMRVLLDVDGLAPTAAAERMGMTKGAITKLAHRLVGKGLVERAADPGDRRAQTLALTPRGRALVPRLARRADENDAAFFGVLSAGDRRDLDRILRRIIALRRLKDVPTA